MGFPDGEADVVQADTQQEISLGRMDGEQVLGVVSVRFFMHRLL